MLEPVSRDISAMSPKAVANVRRLEAAAAELPQVDVGTVHTFHGGMYARTITIPAGVVITGALIKIPTILILSGDVVMYGNDGAEVLNGYNVLRGAAGRKQAFAAVSDVSMTMIFPTDAQTPDDAERAFTDESDLLVTQRGAL